MTLNELKQAINAINLDDNLEITVHVNTDTVPTLLRWNLSSIENALVGDRVELTLSLETQ